MGIETKDMFDPALKVSWMREEIEARWGVKWTFDVTVSPIVVKYLTINKNVNHRGYTINNNGELDA